MHFEHDFSPFRIQTVTCSYPCILNSEPSLSEFCVTLTIFLAKWALSVKSLSSYLDQKAVFRMKGQAEEPLFFQMHAQMCQDASLILHSQLPQTNICMTVIYVKMW